MRSIRCAAHPGRALLLGSLLVTSGLACREPLRYPEAPRGETVDQFHGRAVADPYRWLEELDAPATRASVTVQNALAQPWLEGVPARERVKQRLTELWNHERFGPPEKEGGRYFFTRNDGLQNQSVILTTDRLDAEPRVLLDPNTFRDDGTVSLAGFAPAPDGRHVAYAKSDGGSDWDTWHVREVVTGEDLPDLLTDTKFTDASWSPDGTGFNYSRYPHSADGKGDDSKTVSVYYHRIGTAQADDPLVYSLPEHPDRNVYAQVTDDGRYLILVVQEGYLTNAVYYRSLERPDTPVVHLLDEWDALYTFLGNDGSTFYFQTNLDAPRNRVIAIDTLNPQRASWRSVIAQAEDTLERATLVGRRLIANYLHDVQSKVVVFGLDGSRERDVELPGIGSATGFGGRLDDPETFFVFTSFTVPPSFYRFDTDSGATTLWGQPKVAVDSAAFSTTQVFYQSKDGTRVPMFITYRKGITLDGDNPTLLYGYGGFNVSLQPAFSIARVVWLELGGVLAIPNLRGGGEYGREWHLAGTKQHKQNVFDDFIAAAEYLISNRYTRPERLAIQGGSNGGLLVGAALSQHPELFGAALPAVGVLDMIRYHLPSHNARNWQDDYGLSENAEEFAALIAYSPYHNLKPGTCYPPTLITTADHDDRVVPWHSYKFGAALQHAQGCPNPILVRVETRAGHGAGTPTWMQIENLADQWAFLVRTLRLPS